MTLHSKRDFRGVILDFERDYLEFIWSGPNIMRKSPPKRKAKGSMRKEIIQQLKQRFECCGQVPRNAECWKEARNRFSLEPPAGQSLADTLSSAPCITANGEVYPRSNYC